MFINNKSLFTILIKLAVFLMPFLLILSVLIIMDPLKVFRDYDDYYKNNFVSENRELVCLKLYNKNSKKIKYDSYIFGSSRSLAFKVDNWIKYLPAGANGFHFDASGEGVYGIYNKLKYIDETGGFIENALIVVDYDTLTTTNNREGFLFISPPQLSKDSTLLFYLESLKPFINIKFVIGYLDYSLFRKYRGYMGGCFNKAEYDNISNNITGDMYFGYEKMIENNRDAYYIKLVVSGILSDRGKNESKPVAVSRSEIELLDKIKKILAKHNTNYRIVVSPGFDQIPLDVGRIKLLTDIFGENVYDFSGVNRLTNSIYNYYDDSHFRPHVADEIMEIIYSTAVR